MRRLTGIAALLVMFAMMLPALACAATVSERPSAQDCCRQMHGRCGEMAKQGCCRLVPREDLPRLPAHAVNPPPVPLATEAMVYPTVVLWRSSPGFAWQVPNQHSPPGLLIVAIAVLRI